MHRIGQFVGHLSARVTSEEAVQARGMLPPTAWPLFEAMPVADQRHALNVMWSLQARGLDDPDLLQAALLHDVGKGGHLRLWHRVAGVLLEAIVPRLLERWANGVAGP